MSWHDSRSRFCGPTNCWRTLGVLMLCLWTTAHCSAQLRIVSYNTASGGTNGQTSLPRPSVATVLEAIGDETVHGIARPADIFALQEQSSSNVATQAILDMLDAIYGEGIYDRATLNGNTWGAGRPGLIYNTQTVELLGQTTIGSLSSNGAVRQTLRYQLRPAGYDAAADFYIYNSHYKASPGADNEARRQVEATTIRNSANALGEGAHVLYMGDFNIQSSQEEMYQTLTGSGAGQAFDPIDRPGAWHNRAAFRDVHTQSPSDGSDGGLVAGGVDDRFDFQLVSGEFLDGAGLEYLPGSYHVFGNNGTHALNDPINVPQNTALPDDVLDALAVSSDHLPVIADYRLPARMAVSVADYPDRVIRGTPLDIEVTIENTAPVIHRAGAEELRFTVTSDGSLFGEFSGTDAALGGGETVTVHADTSLAQLRTGRVLVESDNVSLPVTSIRSEIAYTTLDPAQPSFLSFATVPAIPFDMGIHPLGGTATAEGMLFNRDGGHSGSVAGLDLDDVAAAGDLDSLALNLVPFSNLPAGEHQPFSIELSATTLGDIRAEWTLALSDEDIAGAGEHTRVITATATIALPGDANLDGVVDVSDFNIWNQHRNRDGTDWTSGDFNRDGTTNGQDLTIWSANRFRASEQAPPSAVPEPGTVGILLCGAGLIGLTRRCSVLQAALRPCCAEAG